MVAMQFDVAQKPTASKKLFVHTFGCQMNEADTARMSELMARHGYARTPQPDDADLILLNTCAIREKSVQKVLSALGRYRQTKLERGALIGVGGCVGQQEKAQLLKRVPYLDFVFGPDALQKLPDIVRRAEEEGERVVETAWVDSEEYVFPRADPAEARGKVTAFVIAMKGCDNVCAFCVVPRTRGREVSRPVYDVLAEVADLVSVGVREVTLIGQNVNSYRGGCSFAELLRRVAAVNGIRRVRFTTSHPKDLSDDLIAAVGEMEEICPHFHLPVQSGSDRVLERMRREYTVDWYLARLKALRKARPGIAVTTDVIVGYPGETDDDFAKTLDLVAQARYENVYAFVYSARPHTLARLREKEWGVVPHSVKVERLERLNSLARSIAVEEMGRHLGGTSSVLVEGPSRTDPARRFGRTPENRVVNFDGDAAVGSVVDVRLLQATPNAFSGVQVAVKEELPCT
jgi:tRNA-2-methylthio-N6-dimethylallyladenosine synthase